MAIGYTDTVKTDKVYIPGLAEHNVYEGLQKFTSTTASSSTSTGAVKITGGLAVQGNIVAQKVRGAVWNDLADCIEVPESVELVPGCAYCFDGKNYYKSSRYAENTFIGIHSDTAGFLTGYLPDKHQLRVGVKGFVLAYVDKEYPIGTPLTCTEGGKLTKLDLRRTNNSSQSFIATYWKSESAEKWGPEGQEVLVDHRTWVKVK